MLLLLALSLGIRHWRIEGDYNDYGEDDDNENDDNAIDTMPQIMSKIAPCLKDRSAKTRELECQLIMLMC